METGSISVSINVHKNIVYVIRILEYWYISAISLSFIFVFSIWAVWLFITFSILDLFLWKALKSEIM